MSNKVYDILKFIALPLIPALGTLYFGLSKYWVLPYPEEVVGTLTVIEAFLGTLVQVCSKAYNEKIKAREEDEKCIEELKHE